MNILAFPNTSALKKLIAGQNKADQPLAVASIEQALAGAKNFAHRVTNPNVDQVVISFKSELSMQWQEDGSTKPESVHFAIFIIRRGVEYNVLNDNSGCEVFIEEASYSTNGSNGLTTYNNYFKLHGIAASPYQFDITINYDAQLNSQEISGGVSFKVVKLTKELDPTVESNTVHRTTSGGGLFRRPKQRTWTTTTSIGGMNRSRDIMVAHVEERINKPFLYPHSAISVMTIDSKNFKSIPERAYHLKLKKVLVPSNYDPLTRKYNGVWDGLFKGQNDDTDSIYSVADKYKHWTDNPAWIFYDIVTDPRYGCAKYGIEEHNVDKWQLYKIAKYCDELVETEYPIETQNGYSRTFSTLNNVDYTDVSYADGEFVIKIDKSYFENNADGILVKKQNSDTVARENFIREFGIGESFKGKKIAFFINQHDFEGDESGFLSESQIDKIKERSVAKSGKIKTEERYIVSSDVDDFEVRLSGPSFFDDPASFKTDQAIDYVSVDYIKWVDLFRFEAYQDALNDGYVGSKNNWGKQDYDQAIQDDLVLTYLGGSSLPLITEETKMTVGACATQINHPIVEPRFSANIYLTDNSDALGIINNFASIFRGMASYTSGKITAVQDSYKLPIMLFNNSNVDSKGFAYSGTHKNKRYSASLVRFNNMAKNYDPDLVYEENSSTMQKFGYLQNETMGFGITSEGQARRLARWVLFSSQLETEMIKFVAGQEASYLYPSSVFEVSDEIRSGNLRSGRILDIQENADSCSILIDKSMLKEPNITNIEFSVACGMPNETDQRIQASAKFETDEEDQDEDINSLKTPQILKFDATLDPSYSGIMEGPQGQKSILTNLKIKIPFTVSIADNKIIAYNHELNDGDQLRFVSDGILPTGLHPYRVYTVENSTRNSFELIGVSIDDDGKDRLLNSGGIHYFSAINYEYTKKYIQQIMIGSSYSIKGDLATIDKTKNEWTAEKLNAIGVSHISDDKWAESSFFGNINIADEEWIFVVNLGWVYIGDMIDRDSSSNDFFWFFVSGIGWVATTESDKNKFWYVSYLDESVQSASGFIYLKYDQENNLQNVFVYDSSANDSVKSYILGGTSKKIGRELDVLGFNQGEGFWLGLKYGDSSLINEAVEQNNIQSSFFEQNPAYVQAQISNVYKIDANNSNQYKNSVRLEFDDGQSLRLRNNYSINIFGAVNAAGSSLSNIELEELVNKTWDYVFIDDNTIELIQSGNLYDNFESIDFAAASIYYIGDIDTNSKRFLEGQLFRTVSVKEISENKYEVTGLEYSPFKFNAVDKRGSTKQPAMPIPPQADMKVPEPPTNLQLTSLGI